MSTHNMLDTEAQGSHSYLSTKLKKRINHEWWTITIFLCVISIFITIYPSAFGIKRFEHNIYDFYSKASNNERANPDITVITIDDNSLKEFGMWPWRRSIHAQLLEKLSLANSVVLGFIFTEHSPFGKSDDLVLANAIQEHGNTYIPLVYSPIYGDTKPVDFLADSAKGLGHINMTIDSDGIVRSFKPNITSIGNKVIPHISSIALGLESITADNRKDRLIKWSGTANTYETIPYNLVISDQISKLDFKGKYVFVGALNSNMHDAFYTPTTDEGMKMSGAEVFANIADNLISDSRICKLNIYYLILFNLIFVIFTCMTVRFFSHKKSFTLILTSLIFLFGLTFFVFYSFSVWIPPVASMVVIVIVYPLWSWRTQYSALQHIESELTYFISEYSDFYINNKNLIRKKNNLYKGNQTLKLKDRIIGEHSLIDLIKNLHTTLENSRLSNIQRTRLLNFLSHDMRSPLNAILALCELRKSDGYKSEHNNDLVIKSAANLKSNDLDKFEYYAQRTLNLVDSFIDLNRAQISTMNLMDFDIGELIISSCEESWIKAHTKNIKINYDTVDYGYVINADYSLLQRVFINLINNAIQYSFENTQITVNLFYKDSKYIIEFIDQGCGISENHLEAIFSPYSRINNSSDMHKPGVGLGLAFVQTVIKRHNGIIEVESELNKGSNFIITLPAKQ